MQKRLKKRGQSEPVRQDAILNYLRDPIISGRLKPGDRLPTQAQVLEKFRSSPLTVTRAFRQLMALGFARAIPKIGTFVVDRLPYLSRYALVFENGPGGESLVRWSRFHEAVVEAARRVAEKDKIKFVTYYDVNSHPDSEGYQSLMREVENRRLAGIIFPLSQERLSGTSLMERTDLPRVNAGVDPGAIARQLDERHFIYRAIDLLLADGRSRFAVITKPHENPGYPEEFEAAVESRGAVTHPFWTQAVEPHQTKWVRHAIKAILSAQVGELPDGLLITDDHLVEPVAAALAEFGVRVPEQMRVIGHWNFPLPYHGQVPIDLLGFDTREYLRMCVEAIEGQRRGEKIPLLATVPARFSWELPVEETQKHPAGDPAEVKSISTRSVL